MKRAGWALVALLIIAGAAGSTWCYYEHVCMAGHMACHDGPPVAGAAHAEHPPLHYAIDLLWGAAWLIAGALCLALTRGRLRWLPALLLFLLVFRFALGSLGGLTPLPI